MRNRIENKMSGAWEPILAIIISVVIISSGLVLLSNYLTSSVVPKEYKIGAALQVKNIWVRPGQKVSVKGDLSPDAESIVVRLRINNPERYWFEVELANRTFEPIRQTAKASIVTGQGESRIVRIHDRTNEKALEDIKITVTQ